VSDSQVQRAELLADLGRYEEAAAELAGADRYNVPAQTLLARVKLAVGAPKEALLAADAAVAAGPTDLGALIARGMVLADLGRVDEAAAQAEQILREGRGSGYACTSAAAILAEVRNGQAALNAAWEGVRLTPDQPRAHLVLGVVAAGLGMDEIAHRAYLEALALDPKLPVAQTALGMARSEQHRYAQALARLRPVPPRQPSRPPSRPSRALSYGAGYAVGAPLTAAWAQAVGVGGGVVSVLLAGIGLGWFAVAWGQLSGPARWALPRRLREEPLLAVAVGGTLLAPPLLVTAAVTSSPWPLAVAVGAGLAALLAAPRTTLRGTAAG
jgi:tetratricopeptide (TPR) repeat protein